MTTKSHNSGLGSVVSAAPFDAENGGEDPSKRERHAVEAPARVDSDVADLLVRIREGEIAVIDVVDVDRITAEALVGAKAGAVVNASDSISGRYPNVAPLIIAAAGIPIVDGCGTDVMTVIEEGQDVTVDGSTIRLGSRDVAVGHSQTLTSLESKLTEGGLAIGREIHGFVADTLEYLRTQRSLLADGVEIPKSQLTFSGRHVVVVRRDYDYRQDLESLTNYMRDFKPILVGVDAGADAILDRGLTPDLIIGDFDAVSADAMTCGAELFVQKTSKSHSAGRLEDLNIEHVVIEFDANPEDVALLLAYEGGAELIVTVGFHDPFVGFVETEPSQYAASMLARMRVGAELVDAKTVSRLHGDRRIRDVIWLLVAAVATMLVVLAISRPFQLFFLGIWYEIVDLWQLIT